MAYIDLDMLCPERGDQFNHSLTPVFCRAGCRSGMSDTIHITIQFNPYMICAAFLKKLLLFLFSTVSRIWTYLYNFRIKSCSWLEVLMNVLLQIKYCNAYICETDLQFLFMKHHIHQKYTVYIIYAMILLVSTWVGTNNWILLHKMHYTINLPCIM